MPPTLAGHPSVISAICVHLSLPALSRIMRVDRECFNIAGHELYSYAKVVERQDADEDEDGEDGENEDDDERAEKSLPLDMFKVGGDDPGRTVLRAALLAMIVTLDVTEVVAIQMSSFHRSNYHTSAPTPPSLPRLSTLVLRADMSLNRALDFLPGPRSDFLAGVNPELLVLIGDSYSLVRVLNYRRSADRKVELKASWASITRIERISPFQRQDLVMDPVYSTGGTSISKRVPNLQSYDIFYDVLGPRRHPREHETIPPFWYHPKYELVYSRSVIALGLSVAFEDLTLDVPATYWLPVKAARAMRNTVFAGQLFRDYMGRHQGEDFMQMGPVLNRLIRSKVCDARREALLGGVADGGRYYDEKIFRMEKAESQCGLPTLFLQNRSVQWFPEPTLFDPEEERWSDDGGNDWDTDDDEEMEEHEGLGVVIPEGMTPEEAEAFMATIPQLSEPQSGAEDDEQGNDGDGEDDEAGESEDDWEDESGDEGDDVDE